MRVRDAVSHVCVCACVCMYICMYVCMYVCVCVYIYIYMRSKLIHIDTTIHIHTLLTNLSLYTYTHCSQTNNHLIPQCTVAPSSIPYTKSSCSYSHADSASHTAGSRGPQTGHHRRREEPYMRPYCYRNRFPAMCFVFVSVCLLVRLLVCLFVCLFVCVELCASAKKYVRKNKIKMPAVQCMYICMYTHICMYIRMYVGQCAHALVCV